MPRLVISLNAAMVKEVALGPGRTTIGRRPYNDIVLEHPTASGEHAVVQVAEGRIVIEDLGSTNGTYVNGVRIQRQEVVSNDIIEIGKYEAQYFDDDPVAPAEHAAGGRPARLRVLSGDAKNRTLQLTKPVITLGKRGGSVVSITRKRQGYQLAWVEGDLIPEVNGVSVADGPILLCHGDQVNIGSTQMIYEEE
ncbi:MAG: FHA domain-containing protein [Ottowia sp.]|nr:FHA domain-containing protein [Ottowia sp.]